MGSRPSVGFRKQKKILRYLPLALALLVCQILVPSQARAFSKEDVGDLFKVVTDFMEHVDTLERGGKVLAQEPFEFDEAKYQVLQDFSRELHEHSIPTFNWSVEANSDEMFSIDAATRESVLRKLNTGKADQEDYLTRLRNEQKGYSETADKWTNISHRLGRSSEVLENLLQNVGVSVIDQLGGEKMLYSWLDITVYLEPLAIEIADNAKSLANRYDKEIAYRERLLANYSSNLEQLTRIDQALRDAHASNDRAKEEAEKIAQSFKDLPSEAPAGASVLDKEAAATKTAALHAQLGEKLKAAYEKEAQRVAQLESENAEKVRKEREIGAAAVYVEQQRQAAAAVAAQQAAAQQAAAAQAAAAQQAQAFQAQQQAWAAQQAQAQAAAAAAAQQRAAAEAAQHAAFEQQQAAWAQQQRQAAEQQQLQNWQRMQQSTLQNHTPVIGVGSGSGSTSGSSCCTQP